ncbi:MAG: metallopeptidase family protein [Candidatus Omnitrophica bacterium]|nr:metallopeptidase family protein [Candidatus Omnitrophota bacterium]
MKREDFEALVAESIDELPEEFIGRFENIDFVVEDRPSKDLVARLGLRSDCSILGLYHGVPLKRRTHYYGAVLPDKITIYQKNIEIHCKTDGEIKHQIQKTVIHEVAHHFGMTEGEIRKLGF